MKTVNLEHLKRAINTLPDPKDYQQGHIYILNVSLNTIPIDVLTIEYFEFKFICRYIYVTNRKEWELIVSNEDSN